MFIQLIQDYLDFPRLKLSATSEKIVVLRGEKEAAATQVLIYNTDRNIAQKGSLSDLTIGGSLHTKHNIPKMTAIPIRYITTMGVMHSLIDLKAAGITESYGHITNRTLQL